MICPHCNKAIPRVKPDQLKKLVKQLKDEGFSLREMEKLIFKREGVSVSFSTLSRWLNRAGKLK